MENNTSVNEIFNLLMQDANELFECADNFIKKYKKVSDNKEECHDDWKTLENIRNKHLDRIFNALRENDNYIEFDRKSPPIIHDSSVSSMGLDVLSNYIHISINNGENLLNTDLSVEDVVELSNCL